jgi:hypothetical protein
LYPKQNKLKVMGFFSWMTSDTGRSIANQHSRLRPFTVHMITEDGQVFTENNYDGYGEFGGKDFYELLAELNGEKTRSEGITLSFKDNPSGDYNGLFKMPKLVENLNTHVPRGDNDQWKAYFNSLPYPDICPDQGFFYGNNDEECEVCGRTLLDGECPDCDEL